MSALLLAGLTGCASGGPSPGLVIEPAAPGEVRQGIFRVRYRGADARGRLRLVLRDAGEGRFRLDAHDSFGRQVWSFAAAPEGSLLLDHRAEEYCRLSGRVVVEAVALAELPVDTLPRLLFGELPVPPAEPAGRPPDGELRFAGTDGRDWSARFEADRPIAWTLFEEGEPLLWWGRREAGGILSHRDGAQAIWSRTAEERGAAPLEALEVPPGYVAGECE